MKRILSCGVSCSVFLVSLYLATSSGVATGKAALTFSRDVAPIINKNCASCHRPGEVALKLPFAACRGRGTE